MPKRFRLTRRFPVSMTEDGYRGLKRFVARSDMDEGEALSFLFENLDRIADQDELTYRLGRFRAELDARKG